MSVRHPDPNEEVLGQAEAAAKRGEWDRAAAICRSVLASQPNHVGALLLVGIIGAQTGRQAFSVHALTRVLELDPNVYDALIWLGIVDQQLGKFDEARSLFERAHAIKPQSAVPFINMFRGHRMTEADQPLIDRARAALDSGSNTDNDLRLLTYGLAKAYNDLKNFPAAMELYDQANEISARIQKPKGFDRELLTRLQNATISALGPEMLQQVGSGSPSKPTPIFIIGMMRSGTTLVEQILSRHASIHAAGELRFWTQRAHAVIDANGTLKPSAATALAREYQASLKGMANGKPFITDKMPFNYLYAGLLHREFPDAPIIHVNRNPVDTCLSIYMTPYASPPEFAYDREDIAYAYREYQRLMSHWQTSLPAGRMLEVSYEDLVDNLEAGAKKIVEYCGLPWDEACLTPEKNEQPVMTPSLWQVRQPVYKSSVGQSRNYGQWLGALADL